MCFITAGRDMRWGLASSVMEAWPSMRVARMARRVGSARAPKVESREGAYLTIWFSIGKRRADVKRKGRGRPGSEGGPYKEGTVSSKWARAAKSCSREAGRGASEKRSERW